MLELVEGMSEEELREVLEDEGVASIPSGVEEQRDLLRMLTNCNYLEYTYLDAASEQHTASLAQLRQLEDEGDITMETLIWAVRLCSAPSAPLSPLPSLAAPTHRSASVLHSSC